MPYSVSPTGLRQFKSAEFKIKLIDEFGINMAVAHIHNQTDFPEEDFPEEDNSSHYKLLRALTGLAHYSTPNFLLNYCVTPHAATPATLMFDRTIIQIS